MHFPLKLLQVLKIPYRAMLKKNIYSFKFLDPPLYPDPHQNLTGSSLAHPSTNIRGNPLSSFCETLVTNTQTNQPTNRHKWKQPPLTEAKIMMTIKLNVSAKQIYFDVDSNKYTQHFSAACCLCCRVSLAIWWTEHVSTFDSNCQKRASMRK